MSFNQQNLATFKKRLDIFAERIMPQAHLHFQRDIVVAFHRLVTIRNSEMTYHPYDTGWALRNWRVTVGTPKDDTLGTKFDEPMAGPPTEKQIRAQMAHIKPYQNVTVYNNVPYMGELEDGSSKAAPFGIVKPALLDLSVWLTTVRRNY